jgi:hypothetical protein
MKTNFTILVISILLSSNLIAQEKSDSSSTELNEPRSKFKHAIGICPIGLAQGDVLITYEYLLNQAHGLAVMLEYQAEMPAYEEFPYTRYAASIFLNYRYHFSKEMNSIFIGPYFRARVYDGEMDANGSLDYSDPEITLGVYLGKNWVWNNGFKVTLTGGYGPYLRESSESSDEFMDKYIGELSVGYAF